MSGGALNMLSTRVPIGTVRGSDGRPVPVLMSLEFARALADLFTRVGGTNGASTDDLALDLATVPTAAAAFQLAAAVATLEHQVTVLQGQLAALAKLAGQVGHLEALGTLTAPPVDWEHPGKVGASTPNSGQFTTVNRVRFTPPATLATFTLADGKTFTVTNSVALAGADGKTFTVSNTLGLSGTDGAFLNIGTGGTLGSAAYANASAFAPAGNYAARSATALAPVATDAATTQTLANSLRAVLLSVGIGT